MSTRKRARNTIDPLFLESMHSHLPYGIQQYIEDIQGNLSGLEENTEDLLNTIPFDDRARAASKILTAIRKGASDTVETLQTIKNAAYRKNVSAISLSTNDSDIDQYLTSESMDIHEFLQKIHSFFKYIQENFKEFFKNNLHFFKQEHVNPFCEVVKRDLDELVEGVESLRNKEEARFQSPPRKRHEHSSASVELSPASKAHVEELERLGMAPLELVNSPGPGSPPKRSPSKKKLARFKGTHRGGFRRTKKRKGRK
jgi:hypothetical protein